MRFTCTEEQQMIDDTLERVLSETWDARAAAGSGGAELRNGPLRRTLVKLGIWGARLTEDEGGAWALMGTAQAFGRHQVRCDYLSSVVLSAAILRRCETGQDSLQRIASGENGVATAIYEPGHRYEWQSPATTATHEGEGYSITGAKAHVLDGGIADAFIVGAQLSDGMALFLVSRDAPGLSVAGYAAFDGSDMAHLTLENVALGSDALLTPPQTAEPVLREALALAAFAAAAEILGASEAALQQTLEYLGVREQFGRKLAKFQALQHRAADLHMELEMLRSLVIGCANGWEDGFSARTEADSAAAAAYAFEIGDLIGREAIHLHGAIGMTEELGVGRNLLRANALSRFFGDIGAQNAAYLAALERMAA